MTATHEGKARIMSDSTVVDLRKARESGEKLERLASAALAGVALFAALVAVNLGSNSYEARSAFTAAVSGQPVPEMAREWRWERQAYSFDHMYRPNR
jgi:hypothetical protein